MLPVVLIWQINGIYLAALARISVLIFWTADFIQWIVLPTVLLVLVAKRVGVVPRHYGLDTSALRWKPQILGTFGVFITAGLTFYWTRNWAWHLFGQSSGFFTFPGVFPSGPMGTVIWAYSAVTAGLVESVFFISLPWLLYQNLRDSPSYALFSFAASVVFATAHWEQGLHVAAGAFFFNLVACAWYFKLGSLWPVALGHTFVDLVAFS